MESFIVNYLGPIANLIAACTIVFAYCQIRIARRAIQSQSFINLHGLELTSGFQEGIAIISAIKGKYSKFEDFEKGESNETRMLIYRTVSYLNYIALLGENDFMEIQHGWDIYFWSFRICYDILFPWWLEGHRDEQKRLFDGFERACKVIHEISDDKIKTFECKEREKNMKKYSRVSNIARDDLESVM